MSQFAHRGFQVVESLSQRRSSLEGRLDLARHYLADARRRWGAAVENEWATDDELEAVDVDLAYANEEVADCLAELAGLDDLVDDLSEEASLNASRLRHVDL